MDRSELAAVEASGAPGRQGPGRDDVEDLIELYRVHRPRVYAVCLAMLGNPDDAEDATQETFVRATPLFAGLTGDRGTFLRVIARNLCRDEIRRRRRRADAPAADEADTVSTEAMAIDEAELTSIWRKLADCDRVMLAHSFAGYSYEEIAARTGRSMKAVSVAIVRARKRARLLAGAATILTVPAAAWRVLRDLLGRTARSAAGRQTATLLTDLQHVGALVTPAAATLVAAALVTSGPAPAASPGRAPSPPPAIAAVVSLASTPADAVAAPMRIPAAALATATQVTAAAAPARPAAAPAPVATPAPRPAAAAVPATPAPAPLSSYGSPPPPHQMAAAVVSPGADAPQQDAAFSSMTASPGYAQDHTVFASGSLVTGCYRPTCPVLYRTSDGGAHWTSLAATGFAGGAILLPPSYSSATPTVFAIGPLGLQRSDDGGVTFRPVTPTPVAAAMLTTATAGDPEVLLATQPLSVYHVQTGQTTPGPILPLGLTGIDDVAAAADGTVFLTAERADPTASSQQDGVVVRCAPQAPCAVTFTDPAMMGMRLAVSPTFAADHTLLAYAGQRLLVSHDAGATFAPMTSGITGAIAAVSYSPSFAGDGRVLIGSRLFTSGGQITQLQLSTDGARTFQPITTDGLELNVQLNHLETLPGGRILAALATGNPIGSYGIRCSDDGGITWSVIC